MTTSRVTIEVPEALMRRGETLGITVEEIKSIALEVFEKQISTMEAARLSQVGSHTEFNAHSATDISLLTEYCRVTLKLSELTISEEYGYAHLPLCLIDAIFSIGVNYASTSNTVKRFCSFVGINQLVSEQLPDAVPFTISELIALYRAHPIEYVTSVIYQNHQRTSTNNGILKSEAVLRAAEVLQKLNVETIAEFQGLIGNQQFEHEFMAIRGQGSGVSLRYLYMLAGSEDNVKPDRMILRFLESALSRAVRIEECLPLLIKTCLGLKQDFPDLTPRKLDNLIWQFQRTQR